MHESRWAKILFCVVLSMSLMPTSVRAADDTARFNGTWQTTIPYNGQSLTLVSVHDGSTYKNYIILPNGAMPIGDGRFSAVDGKWTATSDKGNDGGTYQFPNNDTITGTNSTGQNYVWKRDNNPLPPIIGAVPPAPAPVPAPAPPVQAPAGNPVLEIPVSAQHPSDITADQRADLQAKLQAGDFDGALSVLNQHGASVSADPALCIAHADLMLKMEDYRQARAEMTFFLQHTFDNADAYVMHARAAAAMGDMRWANLDLDIAAKLRPATADADRKSIEAYSSLAPAGFDAKDLPEELDQLVKMAGRQEPFSSLLTQAMRIVKGENNIRKVEADDYRERKRQLVAAALADPTHAKPLIDLATFLYEQASSIHGDTHNGVYIVTYRMAEPKAERLQAIDVADAALRLDPNNVQAMSVKASVLIALDREDLAQPVIDRALSIDPNQPELLNMFSHVMTQGAWDTIETSEDLAMPLTWEDDKYFYIQQRSPEELERARQFAEASSEDSARSAAAVQAAVDQTKGTAAGFYYQAVQDYRKRGDNPQQATALAAGAMEEAIKLAPDNVGYRDFLAELYGHMGWRKETDHYEQWSIADNLGETSCAKMIQLAHLQLRRRDYEGARQSLTEAMRLDPADARGPGYMGLLLEGQNQDRDQAASWLMAACALEDASLRLCGVRHTTPNISYPFQQLGFDEGIALATGKLMLDLQRPQDALLLAKQAIGDTERIDKSQWFHRAFAAMIPIPSEQIQPPAPHMDPLRAPTPCNTTDLAIAAHQLAGNALKATEQSDQADEEFAAANSLRQAVQDAQRNAPAAPVRR